MYSNNQLFLHFLINSTWKLLVSTKYFLVKYKYKYFNISIHQVHQVLINMYLSTSTVLDPNPAK